MLTRVSAGLAVSSQMRDAGVSDLLVTEKALLRSLEKGLLLATSSPPRD